MNKYFIAVVIGFGFSVFSLGCDDSKGSINTPSDVVNRIKNEKNYDGSNKLLSFPWNQGIIVRTEPCDYCDGGLTYIINRDNGNSVLSVEHHDSCSLASESNIMKVALLYGWGACSTCSSSSVLSSGRTDEYIEYRSVHNSGCPNESLDFPLWRATNPGKFPSTKPTRYLNKECNYCGNKWWSDEIYFNDDYHKKNCRFSKPLPFSKEL